MLLQLRIGIGCEHILLFIFLLCHGHNIRY
jgi:hypothetical protein